MGFRLTLLASACALFTSLLIGCTPAPSTPPPAHSSGTVQVAERPLAAKLSAQDADLDRLDVGHTEPRADMAWRLQTYIISLENYLRTARAALSGDSVPQTMRDHVNQRVQDVSNALGTYRRTLTEAEDRVRRQESLVDELNRDFACNIHRYDQGQQVNFARELSLAECNPLVVGDFKRAGDILTSLAEVSLPVDAEVMMKKAKYYQAVGRLVRDLDQLKRQLLEIKVVRFDKDRPRVDLIGHPFQADNNTNWLEAYIHATRKLNRELERLGEPTPVNGCPEPACDAAIYRVAEAVTLKPPLDWTFLNDASQIMPPTPYGLSYFSQRYDANGEVRWSLDLGSNREWHWRSEDYVNILNAEERTLTFTHIFAEEKVLLSVAQWDQRTEFPYVVPIFYLFKEARRVIELLKTMPSTSVASRIRDIQFAPADDSGNFVTLSKVPEGLRLTLSVLKPAGGRSIEAVRDELHRQIPVVVSRGAVTP